MSHAILSASSAARWLACPPSARINARLPDKQTPYAAEGTKAHALAEKALNGFLGDESPTVQTDDAEMKEAVQSYVDFCIEQYNAARRGSPDASAHVEFRLDYSRYVPHGFGTGDFITVSDKVLTICDLKYGKGVEVSAKKNPQLMLYALGADDALNWLYGYDVVKMCIVQPRLGNISIDCISVRGLRAWGNSIKATAVKAFVGDGELKAGAHCRFCKFRPQCKVLADYMTAKTSRLEAATLSEADLVDVVLSAREIKSWLADVESYALSEALDGRKWPGLKLVRGRSARTITDPDKAAAMLTDAGYSVDKIYRPRELLTLTALEKEIGRKKLAEVLAPVIEKPEGKPTLVSESDKRPEFNPADQLAADFDDSLV